MSTHSVPFPLQSIADVCFYSKVLTSIVDLSDYYEQRISQIN